MSGKFILSIGFAVFVLSIVLGTGAMLFIFLAGPGTFSADDSGIARALQSRLILMLASVIAGVFGMVAGLILVVIGGIKISDRSGTKKK